MGRDDARAVPGLAGGRAPARAFAAYMARAVGGTPPAPLITEADVDVGGLEPDDQVYGISEDPTAPGVYPTPDGAPPVVEDLRAPPPERSDANAGIDDRWLEDTLADPQPPPQ